MSIGKKLKIVVKGLIVSYAVTGMLLAALAYFVFRFELKENITDLAIIGIYVIVTFIGGFITGKLVKEHKFIWGFILGCTYILIIFLISTILGQILQVETTVKLTTAILCIGGGLLGGMLS